MRSLLTVAFFLLLAQTSRALPFGGKPSKTVDDEDAAAQVRVRGAADAVTRRLQADNEDTAAAKTTLSAAIHAFVNDPSITATGSSDASDALQLALEREANTTEMQDFLTSVRRSLHRHPELMYDLPFTSQVIQTTLQELHIPFTTGWAKNTHPDVYKGPGGNGVVAHIGTMRTDQPCVILRADMDALPILEATQHIESFASHEPGKMHACGHDGHVTMLLGAAALLKQIEGSIEGTIRLVFQPAEEGGAGMKRMVEEGVVTLEPRAAFGFGMHVWPDFPSGVVATKPGALMAAAEMFEIVFHGKGGHAAMPHLTIDPVVTASSFILNVQSLVSRNLSPLESGVVSVTHVSTPGDAFNVIPASATLRGTIRSLSTESLLDLRSKVYHMAQSSAAAYGCNVTLSWSPDYYPPTVNDPTLFNEFASRVGALVSKEGALRDTLPTMGGEDFSFLAQEIPSVFFFIGQGSGGGTANVPRTDFGLHHPSFALDENVLPLGVELHSTLAIRVLKHLSQAAAKSQAEEL